MTKSSLTPKSSSDSVKDEIELAAEIFHLSARGDLVDGCGLTHYAPAGLAREGFIHCATRAQLLDVADDYFSTVAGDVVAIQVDPARLGAELRFEDPAPLAGGGTGHLVPGAQFPHVYGPLEREAMVAVAVLVSTDAGFAWPASFQSLDSMLAAAGG